MDTSIMTDVNKRKFVDIAITKMFNSILPNLKQEKGQRIFRPFWNDNLLAANSPGDGCEVFVGRLPRDAFEGELIPLFGSLGQIYESRLMMDFSGFTRGFCYVTYTTKEMADFAIKHLHGIRIRPNGDRICCYRSLDNKMLFLEGLPTHKSIDEIERAVMNALPGVHKIILYADPRKERLNLGVGFVEFVDHRSAANCRKYLWPARLNLWNSAVSVEWAIPFPKYTKNNVLLIKNIDGNMSKPAINKELLQHLNGNIRVLNFYKRSNYAIIQFHSKKDAVFAFQLLNGQVVCGKTIEVKVFDMTQEEAENQLMFEIQMYEWNSRTTNSVASNLDEVDFNRLHRHPTENRVKLSYTILEQYVSPNDIPRIPMIDAQELVNGTEYGLLSYWNKTMVQSNASILPPFRSPGITFSGFRNLHF